MNTRFKDDVKKLFEYWCEIAPTAVGEKVSGVITHSFPESFNDAEIIKKIPEFAYPCQFLNEWVQTYSFVLTSTDSKWRFGFCRHDAKSDTAMVLITYLPWHDTFLKFLNVLGDLRQNSPHEFQPFLAEAYNKGVPEPGASLKLFYVGKLNENDTQKQQTQTQNFIFQRPSQFQLPSIPENYNLSLFYNFVVPKNMIALFAAMLAERRIIFTSQRLDSLSCCVQAANALLYPMVWQHIFIPILPLTMKEILCAPMPFLIGVPKAVLETMTRDELGEVVILNCDNKLLETPFDDVKNMPTELVSQLKKQLNNPHEHMGDRVSRIFLRILVQLIGGYRDAIKFTQGEKITWDRETFIESRPSHLRPFLRNMMELQIFQQFIEERLDMLNTGLGFSDEFELETLRYAENGRSGKHYKQFFRNVKDKTNPAVKSAVQSVKQSSRGVKSAYKDLKTKLSDRTPPKAATSSTSRGSTSSMPGTTATMYQHHSAPNSPLKPVNSNEYGRRSSRSGSMVSPPDHTTTSTNVPTGTLRLLDDVDEHTILTATAIDDSYTIRMSASNSSSSFDTPPDTLPPVPPRIMKHKKHSLLDTSLTSSSVVAPSLAMSQFTQSSAMSFENNFVHSDSLKNASKQAIASMRTSPPLLLPPPLKNVSIENSVSAQPEDVSDNLIQLDSANTSFELEDFDPLNKNAKQLPNSAKPPPVPIAKPTFASVPAPIRVQAFSNPVYPFHVPTPQQSLAAAAKVDEDVELLRKYGLDRFHLNDSSQKYFSCNSTLDLSPSSSGMGNLTVNRAKDPFFPKPVNGNAGGQLNHMNGSAHSIASKKDPWTTFD